MTVSKPLLQGRPILIASRNPGKVREIREIMAPLSADWKSLDEFGDVPEPTESGETFADNARAKALYYARVAGCLALADDSGLQVEALDGRPGIHSARYAGPDRDEAANNARLIRELAGVPPERRSARFCCAVALAGPEGLIAEADGTVEGRIIDRPRGHNGFGYDPHFLVPELGLTTAQLSLAEKARLSHRGRALRALARKLQALP